MLIDIAARYQITVEDNACFKNLNLIQSFQEIYSVKIN